jgi:hypothetical protein
MDLVRGNNPSKDLRQLSRGYCLLSDKKIINSISPPCIILTTQLTDPFFDHPKTTASLRSSANITPKTFAENPAIGRACPEA